MEIKLTPDGRELLRDTLAGTAEIVFTALQLGNGADAGDDAGSLSNALLTLPLTALEAGETFVTVRAAWSNTGVSASFRATELGVLAADPENEGETLLYAYGYVPEAQADYIPAASERILESVHEVLLYIGDAQDVSAELAESIVYASQAEFEAFTARRDNPHAVTAAQVGLGNVQNETPENMTASYTEAAAVELPESGEKLGLSLGKLRAAVRALMNHLLNQNNPHGVTRAQLGAAAASHTHSAADINAGTLSVQRGGTGVDSAAALGALAAANLPAGGVGWEKTANVQKQHVRLQVSLPAIAAGGTQTVSVPGVTASNTVICEPDPTDVASWTRWRDADVRPSAQGAGSLTFSAESATGAAITVNVVIMD